METNQTNSPKIEKIKLDFKDSKYATGRRKTSIAKVWLKKGTGKIHVNGKNYESYFKRDTHKVQILKPFDFPSAMLAIKMNLIDRLLSAPILSIV